MDANASLRKSAISRVVPEMLEMLGMCEVLDMLEMLEMLQMIERTRAQIIQWDWGVFVHILSRGNIGRRGKNLADDPPGWGYNL